ncbi:hypothetical protein FPZ24_01875 [Sphingomonas panacisoli]|uniref:Uncharacterized protein n=1 Tax=Sphingomonas panacisoli TaxID=1813879 RepID=A0A5B8LFD5_9SPHN|nr:hypothetical protein [Sphingomonas panacisoli]QDZ06372.1 hypothetical protein FPZ24_01875 [Sphingomonas panacisoli]
MPTNMRDVVATRRTLAPTLADKFMPLEESANNTAVQAAAFVAAMLDGHQRAALPPSAGADVIELMSEASRLSLQARAKVVQAHDILRNLPQQLGLAFSEPECPPDVVGASPLRAVA